jgi:hypothetical protein
MATENNDFSDNSGVLSTATLFKSEPIPSSRNVVNIKNSVALQQSETAFVEKTLHYISSIRGAVKTNLTLRTNTKYPTRYIILISGLPTMTMNDFYNIKNMNDNIRSIRLSMASASVKIDIWRDGKKRPTNKKKRRLRQKTVRKDLEYDLSYVDKHDKKCLKQLLRGMNAHADIECQFKINIDTSLPEVYMISVDIRDEVRLQPLIAIVRECRTFCSRFEFDFPLRVMRITCLRLAAPLKRRVLRLK